MPAEVSPTNINEIDVTIPEVATNNGLMTELQNLLSVVCYEAVNKKTMKTEELITKMYEQLFSNSTRMGYAEQLIRGEGYFAQLYEKVPVETHRINNNNTNTRRYKLRLKPMLVGGDELKSWFISDILDANKLCMSSIHSSKKLAPRTFYYSCFKVVERNCRNSCL